MTFHNISRANRNIFQKRNRKWFSRSRSDGTLNRGKKREFKGALQKILRKAKNIYASELYFLLFCKLIISYLNKGFTLCEKLSIIRHLILRCKQQKMMVLAKSSPVEDRRRAKALNKTYVDGEQTEFSASGHLRLKKRCLIQIVQAVTFLRFFVNSTFFVECIRS